MPIILLSVSNHVCCNLNIYIKVIFYIIWNILALSMIFYMFIGSIFLLLWKLSQDQSIIISYIISHDNFKELNPFIIQDFKAGKEILEEIFIGEGNFSKVFEPDINIIKNNLKVLKKL